eukprot:CAMPEP_0206258114 /NCGR_PEP_ID=MMETSP0047_2-20121206/25736_1 /ASSEMBLY_ACC=CAM_ASM_000192 /TAXON_ID=195065 /ORGANISM="Chroomonas mesostigmatica_cf, Strain CCMP1168" /LENGTH=30 /DNA_ID= /DNA_START= /DNA_END= /DNA_ORIENTATION=
MSGSAAAPEMPSKLPLSVLLDVQALSLREL